MNIRFNDREKKIISCIKEITGVTPNIPQEQENKQTSEIRLFHINNILLLSSSFNYFQLEEEGRLSTLLTERKTSRENDAVPTITHVETSDECLELLEKNTFDLLIIFNQFKDTDLLLLTKKIHQVSSIPVVLLGNNVAELSSIAEKDKAVTISKIFTWNGDGKIILTIVESIEDAINILKDPTQTAQSKCILLIEDSIQYYSTYLVIIYEQLWEIVEKITQDAISEEHRIQRLKNRPFVLHALHFDEGKKLYELYKNNLVCIITDNQEEQKKHTNRQAGVEFAQDVRKEKPNLPILIQSSEPLKKDTSGDNIKFISKKTPNLLMEIEEFIKDIFGPQEIVIKDEKGNSITTIKNLKDFGDAVLSINEIPLIGVARRHEFSAWLKTRGEYELSEKIFIIEEEKKEGANLRKSIIDALEGYKYSLTQASVTTYERTALASHLEISRIGKGALGGKARGLSFLAKLISKYISDDMFPNLRITIPRTIVLSTEVFDTFMIQNKLHDPALYELPDERIALKFMSASLPATVLGDLRAFIGKTRQPLVFRSSGVLEDSLMQPFAGIYDSILLPNESWETDFRFQEVCNAIKYVYASTYFEKARTYIKSTPKHLGDEKMAVVIQEVVGRKHRQYFYPAISGVAKSYNYYPSGGCKPEEGIVYLALGLGKAIVDGGCTFCFCPEQPTIPMFGTPKDFMKHSQRYFYALNLKSVYRIVNKNEETALSKLDKDVAKEHGVLEKIASTYFVRDDCLSPGVSDEGSTVINFAPIIDYDAFPLAKALKLLLRISEIALGYPVEIEFAVNVGETESEVAELIILQIRSMLPPGKTYEIIVGEYNPKTDFGYSGNVLGNGVIDNIRDIVYVKSTFEMASSANVVMQIRKLNSKLMNEGKPYMLIGPGRWGSADSWLGIPVIWSDIAGAKVIVETPFKERAIDPSQGSHFFHDLISSQVGYLITKEDKGNIDVQWLDSLPVVEDTTDIRHVRTPFTLEVRIDGKQGKAVIQKKKNNK